MKTRIVCNSKHSISYNVFFLNKNTEFSKLHKICSRTKSVLICKIQSILVPPHFRVVPHHFVCSDDGTDNSVVIFCSRQMETAQKEKRNKIQKKVGDSPTRSALKVLSSDVGSVEKKNVWAKGVDGRKALWILGLFTTFL